MRALRSIGWFGGWISLLVAHSATAALQVGHAAPDFSAPASLNGKSFDYSLQRALKQGPVVVYFYPSAYTSGCNIQAHAFAVNHDKFAAAGASIVGVSLDSIERLNQFSADPEFCAGKFPTASDRDGSIAKSYQLNVRAAEPGRKDTRGAEITHGRAERTTFVVTSDGKIAAVIGGVTPTENVANALQAVQRLKLPPLPYSETADAESDVRTGLAAAKKANKKLLLIFGANWCPDCRSLDVALKGQSKPLIESQFVVVKIDVGRFDKNLALVERYDNATGKGIPAAVVVDANDRVLYSTKAGELSKARHMSETGVYDFFNAVVKANP